MKIRKLIMVVNPQLFNYRLIIGSLIVVLTVLGLYSYNKYKDIASYESFLKQEKVLMEGELSDLLTSYDDLSQNYGLMALQLKQAKLETKNALDSLRLLKSDLTLITKYKAQLIALKSKSKILLNTIDSLDISNQQLQKEKRYALNTIKENISAIHDLEKVNDSLHKSIDNAAVLKASSIITKTYKLKSGKKRFSERAKRVNTIDVCITLNENPFALKGEKDVYIQIVNPEGNVVSDQGEVTFGDSSLIYSNKQTVDYNNKDLEVCASIVADIDDKPFKKGYYFINVFHGNKKLRSTSIELL